MSWEYEGLFDQFNPDADDLMTDYWRSEPTAIRVGKMGYRTRTTRAGDRIEAEIFPAYGREKMGILRAARKHQTREAQERANHARSIRWHILLAEANFTQDDYFVHLTYRGEEPTYERCQADVTNFISRIRTARRRKGLPKVKYMYAIEGGEGRERIHVHMLMSGGLSWEEIQRIWDRKRGGRKSGNRETGGGMAKIERLETADGKLEGAVLYIAKELWAKGYRKKPGRDEVEEIARYMASHPGNRRQWCSSRNLTKPKVRTSDTKVSNGRVKKIARGFRQEAEEIMAKVYPGWMLKKCSIYQSDIVDGVYIRCVMRRVANLGKTEERRSKACFRSCGERNTASIQPGS